MSVNFGYGNYGVGNNYNSQQNSSNVFQELKQNYGCEHCYNYGPMPYNYQMEVNPIPYQATHPSLLSRIVRKLTGN